ncbi:MAG: sigma-70 family RNA polymerase sigma factor [Acidobacteria bacterium]|nr:sigma-70 family RNA polymerase sigma factor [Acidobacteriota bacterium]
MTDHSVTALLRDWQEGNSGALDQLLPMIYDELRRIARNYLARERVGHTLQATALVNEAFMKLIDQERVSWQNRAHFFALAATMMRRILVDHSRHKNREKRGDGAMKVTWSEAMEKARESEVDVLALDDALTELERLDERQAKIVSLRYFAGLTVEECAEVLEISDRTVKREWRMARAWLHRRLTTA